MEQESIKILTAKDKKDLLTKVNKLKKKEHLQIFKIIKETDINFSENSNGIFINLNNVENNTLLKIKNFTDICYQNNIEFDERKKQMEQIYENYEKFSLNKKVENIVQNEENEREPKYNTEIKNNKKLSSLEKAIVRNSVNKDINEPDTKNNVRDFNKKLPKYTGTRAKILKTCKELNKNISYNQTVTKSNQEENQNYLNNKDKNDIRSYYDDDNTKKKDDMNDEDDSDNDDDELNILNSINKDTDKQIII